MGLCADAHRVARLAADHRLRFARGVGAWRSSARWSWRWVIGAGRHVCCSLRWSLVSPARVVALVVQRPAPGAGSLTGAVSVERSFPSLPTAIAAAVALTLVRECRSANRRRQIGRGRGRRRARRRPGRERLGVAARRGSRVHLRRRCCRRCQPGDAPTAPGDRRDSTALDAVGRSDQRGGGRSRRRRAGGDRLHRLPHRSRQRHGR